MNILNKKILYRSLVYSSTQVQSITYYSKPCFDLKKKISDDLNFKELWSVDSKNLEIPSNKENLFKGSTSLIKKSFFRALHGSKLKELQQDLTTITNMIKGSIPDITKQFRKLFAYFPYPKKFLFSEILLALMYSFQKKTASTINKDEDFEEKKLKYKVFQLCYCMEMINLALYLNSLINNQVKSSTFIQRLFMRDLNDQKLLLASDFFHTKASRMSALIGRVEIPSNLSIIEEEAAKMVFLKQKNSVDDQEKLEIAYYENGVKMAYGFQSLALILFGETDENILNKYFKAGANLGIYLHLTQNNQESLNPQRFLANFLNELKSMKIDSEGFVSKLQIILK